MYQVPDTAVVWHVGGLYLAIVPRARTSSIIADFVQNNPLKGGRMVHGLGNISSRSCQRRIAHRLFDSLHYTVYSYVWQRRTINETRFVLLGRRRVAFWTDKEAAVVQQASVICLTARASDTVCLLTVLSQALVRITTYDADGNGSTMLQSFVSKLFKKAFG